MMTTSPNPDDPDTEGKTVPPYDGRREAADIDGPEKGVKDGARTSGATGPIEGDEVVTPEPDDTERGATASPADEQPGSEQPETDLDPDVTTGASHEPGTGRAEDKP
ncbi:hypothetical protein BH18ACT9_BH18ACT9_01890 [soil metagenome]